MNRTIKIIVTIGFIMICALLFSNMKVSAAEPTPELETIIDMTQVTGFVANGDSLQLYFNDGTGYYWEYEDTVIETTTNIYVQYDDNLVDMDTVIDFDITEYGLQLYLNDGSGYYLALQNIKKE